MSRITKGLIEEIIKAAQKKAGVDDRRAAYKADREKLFEACRIEHCGGAKAEARLQQAERAYQELRSKVPGDAREAGMYRLVNLECRGAVSFGGCRDSEDYSGEQRIRPNGWLLLAADHPLTVEWERLRGVKHDIDSQADSVEANVRGMLSKFTTVKKLLEVWPEARELLPSDKGAAPSINLPAVQVSSLNALIGLPSEPQGEAA